MRPLPATAPAQGRIPGKLGAVRRDWGYVVAAYLTVWAPFVAACSAYGGRGPILGGLYDILTWLLGAVLSLFAIGLLKNQLGSAQRILREDAAAGSVHAIRVRFRTPVREAYQYTTGDRARPFATSSSYCIELEPENDADMQRTIRLEAMYSGHNFHMTVGDRHLAQAAARLVGHSGWLCWPTRWRDSAATDKQRRVAAAFVSDSGHVVWGVTPDKDHGKYLRAGAAPVRETDSALTARPLPRPSRYFPKVHPSRLGVAAVGALLAVPYLLSVVPHWAALLLGLMAGAVGLFAGMAMGGGGVDQEPWTVRRTSRPSPR
ncbi:hypothetical protein [Streptomyces sp. NPDC003996]